AQCDRTADEPNARGAARRECDARSQLERGERRDDRDEIGQRDQPAVVRYSHVRPTCCSLEIRECCGASAGRESTNITTAIIVLNFWAAARWPRAKPPQRRTTHCGARLRCLRESKRRFRIGAGVPSDAVDDFHSCLIGTDPARYQI